MKKALIIGIDHYSFGPLNGCIADAEHMASLLRTHENQRANFDCKLITSKPEPEITDGFLREEVTNFFSRDADSALLYFSGHGSENTIDGYLVSQNATAHDPGLAFNDVMRLANQSPIKEINIILDCCHAGHMANWSLSQDSSSVAAIKEGISILSSSRGSEYSVEKGGRGLFTSIICDALSGGAADIRGRVTIASIYTHADQILGPWDQRPLFKSHASRMNSIRQCAPAIEDDTLKKIGKYFDRPDFMLPLNPSYEPTVEPFDQQKEEIFADLQRMVAVRLVTPVGEDHMYFAAMNKKACQLTALGKFYWKLVTENRI